MAWYSLITNSVSDVAKAVDTRIVKPSENYVNSHIVTPTKNYINTNIKPIETKAVSEAKTISNDIKPIDTKIINYGKYIGGLDEYRFITIGKYISNLGTNIKKDTSTAVKDIKNEGTYIIGGAQNYINSITSFFRNDLIYIIIAIVVIVGIMLFISTRHGVTISGVSA